jgi:hypothetical protein
MPGKSSRAPGAPSSFLLALEPADDGTRCDMCGGPAEWVQRSTARGGKEYAHGWCTYCAGEYNGRARGRAGAAMQMFEIALALSRQRGFTPERLVGVVRRVGDSVPTEDVFNDASYAVPDGADTGAVFEPTALAVEGKVDRSGR